MFVNIFLICKFFFLLVNEAGYSESSDEEDETNQQQVMRLFMDGYYREDSVSDTSDEEIVPFEEHEIANQESDISSSQRRLAAHRHRASSRFVPYGSRWFPAHPENLDSSSNDDEAEAATIPFPQFQLRFGDHLSEESDDSSNNDETEEHIFVSLATFSTQQADCPSTPLTLTEQQNIKEMINFSYLINSDALTSAAA